MPYSFTKIEEDKTRTIGFVFFFLLFFYFASFWLIALLVKSFFLYEYAGPRPPVFFSLNLRDSVMILAAALLAGYAHWTYTTSNLVTKISSVLKAEPLNKNDTYHQRLQNIIDEVSVATGGRKIEGMVIPTSAMNAFALMDFESHAVIGVTEGLLARLTRAQLEAVVGHEAAHIVSGDHGDHLAVCLVQRPSQRPGKRISRDAIVVAARRRYLGAFDRCLCPFVDIARHEPSGAHVHIPATGIPRRCHRGAFDT